MISSQMEFHTGNLSGMSLCWSSTSTHNFCEFRSTASLLFLKLKREFQITCCFTPPSGHLSHSSEKLLGVDYNEHETLSFSLYREQETVQFSVWNKETYHILPLRLRDLLRISGCRSQKCYITSGFKLSLLFYF